MPFRTLDGVELAGKRVLVRADLNVPMHGGEISDTTRLERLVLTLHELMDGGAKVIVCSHFERPKGKRVPSMSLRPVADALGVVLARPVAFTGDCVGPEAEAAVAALSAGEVLVLENTRFHAGEEANDPAMAQQLAGLADIYVNDAFSAAHRAHASTEGVARLLPSYAGRLMQQELEALDAALGNPVRPVCAVVGGSKVSTKLELLGNLVGKVDMLVIGGAMANTFLAAQGAEVGRSLQEADMHEIAREIMQRAEAAGCKIVLPTDAVVAREFKAHAATEIVSARAIPADAMMLDVGPETVHALCASLPTLKTIVWNGPLGAFETEPFDRATNELAHAVGDATEAGVLRSVAGGGDTVSALKGAGEIARMTYVSSAGGAFLEWLEGKTLPGVAALEG